MYNITKNGIITVNRGDSFTISLPLNVGTPFNPEYYRLGEDDEVYFGLMEPNQPFEFALVRKIFTKDNQTGDVLNMSFRPEDTEKLLPGRYYYSIKIVSPEEGVDLVYTVVPNTKFNIID